MDWRKRSYYLVRTASSTYDIRHKLYKIAAPSLKRHSAYNHFIGNKGVDISSVDEMSFYYPQEMLSCKIEESEALEYELKKAKRRDGGSRFVKLTKEKCGQ